MFVLYTLFQERLVFRMNTGGAGIVSIMTVVVPIVVFLLLVLPDAERAVGYFRERSFWMSSGPFLMMGFLIYPIGVIVYGRPIRILWGMIADPLVMLSFVSLGFWAASRGKSGLDRISAVLRFMIVFESVYAIAVLLQKQGLLSLPLLDQLALWDRTSQIEYKSAYLLDARAIGTYINPNSLGITLGLFWCWAINSMRRTKRVLVCSLILTALYFCDSRGSWFGVIATIPFILVKAAEKSAGFSHRSSVVIRVLKVLGSVALVASLFAILLTQEGLVSERMLSGFNVFVNGVQADQNFADRMSVWQKAPTVLAEYPFGVLGPPEMVLNSYVDSEYVELILQGGIVLLFTYFLLLAWGIASGRRHNDNARIVGLSSVFIVVNSVSALPLASPGFALYWYELGVLYNLFRTRNV
jgi:hypothetical protein